MKIQQVSTPAMSNFLCNGNTWLALFFLLLTSASHLDAKGQAGLETKSLTSSQQSNDLCNKTDHQDDKIHLVTFRWEEIGVYFTISAFVVIAGFAKLGFHKLKWLSSKVPESCLLVLLGLAVSALIYFTTGHEENTDPCHVGFQFPQFTSETFFLILLPPIILDSAYSLHDRVFLDNLGTVLVFAVVVWKLTTKIKLECYTGIEEKVTPMEKNVNIIEGCKRGTLFNVFAIGASLYGVNQAGLIPSMDIPLADALVFSSLISAVDPVAVLAIFQELGVNQNLYFLIFGESLLNDGVTVVVYNVMQSVRKMLVVTVGQCFMAILSFIIVCFGAIFIGVFYGLLTAIVTKWTNNVRVVEPLAMLGLAYLSYLTAELFHFSGIISLIVCGLIQAHFGFLNISQKSYTCVKYFTKMASATSDTIIFMFLGIVLVNEKYRWNTEFVLWCLFFCLVFRFISVFTLSALTNIYRTRKFGFEEQFIAAYGGLRGAVAFSLATTLDSEMTERHVYIFTTLIVILFTIFIQGITIKPLVHFLNIQKRNREKKSMVEEISESSMDHMMAGIEEILGHHGDFYLRELLMHYNDKYLKKWFLHETSNTKLTRLFEKIALSEHYAHLYGPVAMVEDHMKPLMSFPSKDEDLRISPVLPLMQQEEMLYKASFVQKNLDPKAPVEINIPKLEDPTLYRPFNVTIRHPPRKFSLAGWNVTSQSSPSRKRTRSLFNPRSVAPLSSASTGLQPTKNDTALLRRALRDNKYNKLHYTYNRNLVDEEDQEMINHLSRRSYNARRMTSLASASYRNTSKSPNDPTSDLPGQVNQTRGRSVTYDPLSNAQLLRERHERRSQLLRRRVRCLSEGNPPIREEPRESPTKDSVTIQLESNENSDKKSSSLSGNEEIPLLELRSKNLISSDKPEGEI